MAAYAAVVSLKKIIATIKHMADCLYPPSHQQLLQFIDKELESIQEFLERLDSSSRKRIHAPLGLIAEAIRRFEDRFIPGFCREDVPQDLKQDFIDILKKVVDLKREPGVVSRGNKSKMVGLSDVYGKLKEEIVGHPEDALAVFLVGMAGIGKTTLAREIFEDLDILEWFDCRVWVTLGREWNPEEVTQTILAQVDPDADKIQVGGYEEIVEYTRARLRDKRCFIVLDDAWDEHARKYMEGSLPINKNGSRVLLTTRIRFHGYPGKLYSSRIEMRLLNKEESWNLLHDKVFAHDSCPLELEKAGKKIAEKCDGLPLTVITVANLLLKAEENLGSLLIAVAEQKKHQLFTDAYDEISKVLYPIYYNLVQEFKLCFLYMGVFPQNCEIPKSKVINLWIAEEIIELMEYGSLEESAVKCLRYLAFFSFVMMYQISDRSYGHTAEKIKTCGLHSSWWHFCNREAEKSKFFHVLDSYKDGLGEGIKQQSRLSIHNNVLFGIKDVCISMEESCASTAHSLLCFGPYHQYPVSICFGLDLLQKLDALNIRFYKFPLEVLKLAKLRYLALTCNGMIPPSISKLLKLQFLIINRHLKIQSNGSVSYLPMEIWDMKELKHLQVMGCDLPDLCDSFLPKLSRLLDVSSDSCTKGVFERIPKLKKLGIRIELVPNDAKALCCFNHISHLNELKSLTCAVVNPEWKPKLVPLSNFPLRLKKLNLIGLGYPWKEINKIASLPHLKVLKLRCNAFRGPKWEVKENGFPNLCFLLLEDMNLVRLKGTSGSFKNLSYISIKHCYKLKDLGLRSFMTVSKIEILDCNPLIIKEIKLSVLDRCQRLDHLCVHSSWNS